MRSYNVVPTRVFTKDFRCLPRDVKRRILSALESRQQDPYGGRKAQAIDTGAWRRRVGDYRIRYYIEGGDIVLLRVRHRREAYRD